MRLHRPRQHRSRNRLIIVFIACACLTSLYILTLKIRRMIYLSQMEENSVHSAIINDILMYNSSYSTTRQQMSELKFLITSQIHNFYLPMTCDSKNGYSVEKTNISLTRIGNSLILGTCEIIPDPLYISLKLDDFILQIDVPDRLGSSFTTTTDKYDDVICMSHLILYEDGATILSLLNYFNKSVDRIFIYAASVSNDLYKILEKYAENIEIVPWKMPENRKHDDFDKLKIDADFVQAAVESSLTHCFLKNAPIAKKLTLIDLVTLRFESTPFSPEYRLNLNVTKLVNENWRLQKLSNYRVSMNSQNDVVLSENCLSIHPQHKSDNWENECSDLLSFTIDTMIPTRSVYIPKIVKFDDNQNFYGEALERCTSYKSTTEDHRKLMKFEFELKNTINSDDVCEIALRRNDFKCRVAMDYNKKMFRRRTRLLITHKRSFLRFNNGCHL